jgi:hypothetical protein
MYEQNHWEHQEKLLILRQMRNSVQFNEDDTLPVSYLNTPRLHVVVPTPSFPALPAPPQPGYDDIYDEISHIGSFHSVTNTTQSVGQDAILQYTEEKGPPCSTTAGEEDVGAVNNAMKSFFEALQSQSTQESTKQKSPGNPSSKPSCQVCPLYSRLDSDRVRD